MKLIITLAALAAAILPLTPAQASIFGGNLIVNAGAEAGPGSDGVTPVSNVPAWTRTGGCDVFAYATAYKNTNGLIRTDIVPRGPGNNYFSGGLEPATCTFTQTIDLSSGGTAIDAGAATFDASGYLGGYQGDGDNATVTVAFQGAGGNQLSSVTLGPVLRDDRASRETGLYFRRQIGSVPAGTRKAAVTLTMNWVDGTINEADADNLSLALYEPASPQSLLGVNLITNPGADASLGLDQNSSNSVSHDLPGWVRSAFFTADSYQDPGGDLYQVTGGPPDAGSNYFYGGVDVSDSANPIATAFQDIDVSSAATLIDSGNLPFTLAGWVGGFSSQDDNAVLTAQFRDWSGTVLATAQIGPVLAADRNGNTELLQKSTNGSVPSGTRQIHVLLTMTRQEGSNNDGIADSLSLVLGSAGNIGPSITGSIISAGAYGAFDFVALGTWMEIYGENLAPDTRPWGQNDFAGNNAPTSLDAVHVSVGGQPAFVYYISPGQLDVLVPGAVGAASQPVVVTNAKGTSAALPVVVNSVAPGLLAPGAFAVDGNQYLAALLSDGSFVLPAGAISGVNSRPARPGETITTYGIGFGAVTPNVPAGQIAGGSSQLSTQFQITFGSTPATLSYFGLAPGFVGLYQFNIVVPNIDNSDLVPVAFSLGGESGFQTLFTAVHN